MKGTDPWEAENRLQDACEQGEVRWLDGCRGFVKCAAETTKAFSDDAVEDFEYRGSVVRE